MVLARNLCILLLCLLAVPASGETSIMNHTIDLSGTWQLLTGLDSDGEGFPANLFDQTIQLPGTTETRRIGPLNTAAESAVLTRRYYFVGPAWYQKTVTIPDTWDGYRVTLNLERTKYTKLWLDGVYLGDSITMSVPQHYDLGLLKPGQYTLTLHVDNRLKIVDTEAHLWSDNTQSNWNGILGDITLTATPPVAIQRLRVDPSLADKNLGIEFRINNATDQPATANLTLTVTGPGLDNPVTATQTIELPAGVTTHNHAQPLPDALPWDEFNPNLYQLELALITSDQTHQAQTRFGFIDIATRASQFTVNNRPTFLRGTHDGCVFPLTGHPPMNKEGWLRYFRICRDYGLNYIRCHSWCPPEAAFEAADELGIYLHPELPFWGDFTEEVRDKLRPEALAIIEAYGNHPSFTMFGLGNENRYSREIMGELLDEVRAYDNDRRLFTQGCNNFMWDPILQPTEDFITSAKLKNDPDGPARFIRGGTPTFVGDLGGHIQENVNGTRTDYSDAIEGVPGPAVSHENGQWTVFPDYDEIEKYTGVFAPRNLERFRDRLRDAGMLDQDKAFQQASGKLAVILYREDIEACLRTPGFGGFHLLDLKDFPGQGTALVGILDAFLDSKNLITPEEWRHFCAPEVLLARFDTYTWSSDQTFTADLQLAHYGQHDLTDQTINWSLATEHTTIASGSISPITIKQGNVRDLGTITASLADITTPTRLDLRIEAPDANLQTAYPIWVYPAADHPEPTPDKVLVTDVFDDNARNHLEQGGSLVICLVDDRLMLHSPGGDFPTDYWNWPMFHNPPGTMGLLINPDHPALAHFPTEFHSNWQWYDIAEQSQPISIANLPADLKPIIQTIDNYERVDKLGLLFEAAVGQGKLLICAAPLIQLSDTKPEARALLNSLTAYAASDAFQPTVTLTTDAIADRLTGVVTMNGTASASTTRDGWPPCKPTSASDNNEGSYWQASEKTGPAVEKDPNAVLGIVVEDDTTAADDYSHLDWWQFTFDQPVTAVAAQLLWADDAGHPYTLEVSPDGDTWHPIITLAAQSQPTPRHTLDIPADHQSILAFRVTIDRLDNAPPPALSEARLIRPQP